MVEDKYDNPDHYLPIALQSNLLGQSEYFDKHPAIEKHSEELAQEANRGAFVDVTYTCVVGRKERSDKQ